MSLDGSQGKRESSVFGFEGITTDTPFEMEYFFVKKQNNIGFFSQV